MSMSENFAPSSSPNQITPFMRIRSTTPLNSPSAPIGIWHTAVTMPSFSFMESTAL